MVPSKNREIRQWSNDVEKVIKKRFQRRFYGIENMLCAKYITSYNGGKRCPS